MSFGFLDADEISPFAPHLEILQGERRATRIHGVVCAAERLPEFQAIFLGESPIPAIEAPAELKAKAWTREEALLEVLRDRLQGSGPVTARGLGLPLSLAIPEVEQVLLALETEGSVMRGRFTPGATEVTTSMHFGANK